MQKISNIINKHPKTITSKISIVFESLSLLLLLSSFKTEDPKKLLLLLYKLIYEDLKIYKFVSSLKKLKLSDST